MFTVETCQKDANINIPLSFCMHVDNHVQRWQSHLWAIIWINPPLKYLPLGILHESDIRAICGTLSEVIRYYSRYLTLGKFRDSDSRSICGKVSAIIWQKYLPFWTNAWLWQQSHLCVIIWNNPTQTNTFLFGIMRDSDNRAICGPLSEIIQHQKIPFFLESCMTLREEPSVGHYLKL